ncbi:hypothetical protein LPJ70_007686, partial [Coemansia sp. RSA 2708]
MAKSTHRNQLAPGISRLSRSQVFSKRAAYKVAKQSAPATKAAPAATPYTPYVKDDLLVQLTATPQDKVAATRVPRAKA